MMKSVLASLFATSTQNGNDEPKIILFEASQAREIAEDVHLRKYSEFLSSVSAQVAINRITKDIQNFSQQGKFFVEYPNPLKVFIGLVDDSNIDFLCNYFSSIGYTVEIDINHLTISWK